MNHWQIPLSKKQKIDLDNAIIDYINWHYSSSSTLSSPATSFQDNYIPKERIIESLSQLFQLPQGEQQQREDRKELHSGQGQLLLPRKWNSIIQLQKKIMSLETTINQLNNQLEQLKENQDNTSLPTEFLDQQNNNKKNKLWIPKENPFTSFLVESPITAIKLHPFLPMVIIGTNNGKLYIYDILNVSLPLISINAHTKAITSIDIIPPQDEKTQNDITIITASKDLNIRLWNWNSMDQTKYQLLKTLTGHDHIISQINSFINIINNNDKTPMLVSCSRDNTIKFWNLTNGWCVRTIKDAHTDWIRSIDILGEYLLSTGNDTSIRLIHWPTGNGLSLGLGHNFPIEVVKFIPLSSINNNDNDKDNSQSNYNENLYKQMGFKYCLSGGRDNIINMWEIPTPNFTTQGVPIPNLNQDSNKFKLIKQFKGHTSWVKDLKLVPSALTKTSRFISCSDDKSLRLWDISTGEVIKTWSNFHSGFINCIDIDEQNNNLIRQIPRKLLATGGIDCQCNILMN